MRKKEISPLSIASAPRWNRFESPFFPRKKEKEREKETLDKGDYVRVFILESRDSEIALNCLKS